MKKILYALFVVVILFALYSYQRPILSTEAAVEQAYEYLKNPSAEMEETVKMIRIQIELDEVPEENISWGLRPQEGFMNQLINKQQWEVTIEYQDVVPTVVLDAYTGEFITIFGPLN